MYKQVSILILLALFSVNSVAAKKQQIPVSAFNQMPMVQQPTISPDGKNIAVITNQGDNTQVSIVPFENKKSMSVILELGGEKFRIDSIKWVNNERIIAIVSQPLRLGNIRLRTTHIYSASIDGKDVIELKKRAGVKQSALDFYRSTPRFLSLLRKDKDHILVTINDKRDAYYSSVFKVNVKNGDYEKYITNSKKIVSWSVNRSGEILMAVGVDNDKNTDIKYIYTRKNSESPWVKVKEIEAYNDDTFSVVQYEPETNSIIIISDRKLEKDALWRYDIATGAYSLMAEAPGMLDIDGAVIEYEGDERKVVGIRYTDHFSKRILLDNESQSLNKQISTIFNKNGLQAFLYDWDKNKQRYIISSLSDTKPPKFFLFDLENPKIIPWYSAYPALARQKLAPVKPFEFKARDGMALNGYITLPLGVKNPPLIVHPHGGPYGVRDKQYFDPFVQLFASRGYAVLQVNYRGSGGFGNEYETSGYEKWGKEMQTDLIDAINWVKTNKLANTDSSCIAGASYGGYAALAAGYQTPEQFKCIVSIAGVGDMDAQVTNWRRRGAKSYIENVVNIEAVSLKPISPVHFAERFKAPVLLIHGKVDTRVSYRQSEDMYNALKKANKDVELELFKFGTHNLNDSVNRKKAMVLMIEFIDKHLK
jgi:dipeptidyl aminopeptidase/acylaminoacyl peptidase